MKVKRVSDSVAVTVGELVAFLQGVPPETPVFVPDEQEEGMLQQAQFLAVGQVWTDDTPEMPPEDQVGWSYLTAEVEEELRDAKTTVRVQDAVILW